MAELLPEPCEPEVLAALEEAGCRFGFRFHAAVPGGMSPVQDGNAVEFYVEFPRNPPPALADRLHRVRQLLAEDADFRGSLGLGHARRCGAAV